MAKVSRFILEYKQVIESTGLSIDEYSPNKKTMKRFIRIFKKISDVRIEQMIAYPLYEILVIAFMAILANGSGWADMEAFGKEKIRWLKKFLPLENGIPSHDTFQRVFSLINYEQLQIATVEFIIENMDALKKSLGIKVTQQHICIDGKEACSTGRKYTTDDKVKNLQMLHVYDASNEICLFSKAIDEKTNEIPVAQEILSVINLKDAIVTFDALHVQHKTIELIRAGHGNYIGSLKGNQGCLEADAFGCFDLEIKKKIQRDGKNYYKTIDKAHSQVETREYYLAKAELALARKKSGRILKVLSAMKKQSIIQIQKRKQKKPATISLTLTMLNFALIQ